MQHRTTIVIAHRLATVLRADQILVMEGGRVVARGRHSELLETSEAYRHLYELQFMANRDRPANLPTADDLVAGAPEAMTPLILAGAGARNGSAANGHVAPSANGSAASHDGEHSNGVTLGVAAG